MRLLMLAALVLTSWSGIGAPQATAPRNWSEVRDAELGFRIELPAQAQKLTLESGEFRWAVELDNGSTAYIVGTTLIPQARLDSVGPLGVLDAFIAGVVGSVPGAIGVSDKALTIGGNPGREVAFKVDQQGTPMKVIGRVLLVKARLFTIIALANATHDQVEIDRVLNSFALIAR